MDLFTLDGKNNLLPYDGEVYYYGKVMRLDEAQYYLDRLLHCIEWKNDEAFIFGRRIITKRKAAWYGDHDYSYTYSNSTKQALPWTQELVELKKLVEEITLESLNSCLLNLYHNGDEGMAYHSDDEKSLALNSAIASLSFGAERKFLFRHKQTKVTTSVLLEKGSLLVMKGATQTHWVHRLPPIKRITGPRVNLTFRTMIT